MKFINKINIKLNSLKKIWQITIYSLIFSFFIIGIACEKTINIDLEDAKIKIVVNGLITPDSTITVNVTRSRHILDNANISSLTNATVNLYENNVLIGNMNHIGNGNYKIEYYPKFGKEYKVKVEHPDYDDVFGVTKVLPNIPITKIDTSTVLDEYGDKVIAFNINFTDPTNEENYYLFNISNTYTYEEWDENIITYDTLYVGPDTTIVDINYGGNITKKRTENLWFNSDDIIIEEYMWSNGVIFSDEIINGSNYTLTGEFNKWALYSSENTITFELYALSPETFKYYKSVNQHYNTSEDPFAEPVIVYTNIENGIGIFGGSSVYKDSIIVVGEEWEYYDY